MRFGEWGALLSSKATFQKNCDFSIFAATLSFFGRCVCMLKRERAIYCTAVLYRYSGKFCHWSCCSRNHEEHFNTTLLSRARCVSLSLKLWSIDGRCTEEKRRGLFEERVLDVSAYFSLRPTQQEQHPRRDKMFIAASRRRSARVR